MPRKKPSPVRRSVRPAGSSSQAARKSVRTGERWLPPAAQAFREYLLDEGARKVDAETREVLGRLPVRSPAS